MRILPQFLCSALILIFTVLLPARPQSTYLTPNTTSTNITSTNTTSTNTTNTNSTQDVYEKCLALPACGVAFDIIISCGFPQNPLDDPTTPYREINNFSDEEWKCNCKTLGFVRNTIQCFMCYGIDATGWETWCVSTPPKKLSPGAIAGIVIGLLFAGAISYAIYWRLRNRKRINITEVPVFRAVTKTELDGGGAGVAREYPVNRPTMEEIDGYEMRAELPSP